MRRFHKFESFWVLWHSRIYILFKFCSIPWPAASRKIPWVLEWILCNSTTFSSGLHSWGKFSKRKISFLTVLEKIRNYFLYRKKTKSTCKRRETRELVSDFFFFFKGQRSPLRFMSENLKNFVLASGRPGLLEKSF